MRQILSDKRAARAKAARGIAIALEYAVLILFALAIAVPFVQTLLASFKPASEIALPNWIPKKWRPANYLDVFRQTAILRSFVNTLLYILPPVVVGTFMSALCAYGFARIRFPGSRAIFLAMMATLVIPNIIIMIPAYVMFANFYRWVGTPWPVIVPGMFGSTVTMFFLLQFIRMLPEDVEEAARIDGLNRMGIFWQIVVPLSMPAIITQLILSFNGAYNDFLTPLLYLGTRQDMYTVQLAINSLNLPYVRETEKMLAACFIALLPTFVLFIFAQKYFIEGIAITGLK